VQCIAYFCGVLDERELRAGARLGSADEQAYRQALAFLEHDVGGLLPGALATRGRALDWSLLVGSDRRTGPDRLRSQYWRANTSPSERYVLTTAGSVQHRLGADESGVRNLVLAGDWTRNGIDGGCVEAAVTSGMQAARALIGHRRAFSGEDPRWLRRSRGVSPRAASTKRLGHDGVTASDDTSATDAATSPAQGRRERVEAERVEAER
jgi:hypothetical protein